MALKTNFTDDILAESMNGKRQYNVTENSNGTKSLEDVTDYQSVGSNFSAKDMNETNAAVNQAYDDMGDEFNKNTKYLAGAVKIHNNKLWKFKVDHDPGEWDESQVRKTTLLDEIGELNENLGDLTFAQDADGNWGYKVGGADPVIPFGGSLKPLVLEASQSYTADQSGYVLAFGAAANANGSNFCSVTITKNGNAVTPKFATANSLKLGAAWIPVDKGDVISIIPKGVNSNYQASMICFI